MNQLKVTLFGMARYHDWVAGVSNRQLELLDLLHRRDDVESVLAVDILPWRIRDVAKGLWGMTAHMGKPVPGFGRPWRSLRQVSPKLHVLTSVAAYNGLPTAQFRRDVEAARSRLNLGGSTVWSYVPTLGEFVAGMPRGKLLFDAVDSWLAHPFYSQHRQRVAEGYAAYARSADVITTVNPSNAQLFPSRTDVVHVPNGVSVARYDEDLPVPFDLATLPRPIVGYVGTIQGRLDVEIIRHLSQNLDQGSIVLIGPVWYRELAAKLAALPHVHLFGRQPRWLTPAYVQHFDVGIVPHRPSEFLSSTEAMKVYEYLAAGLPIVATPGAGSAATSRYIAEAATPERFTAAVLRACANLPLDARARREAAAAADWSKRLDAIVSLL